MSKLFDRIENCVKNEISNDDAVALWNTFAEKNSYEQIYSMSEFDEIIGSDRSYHEVKEILDDDFDESNDYFYFHSGTGYAVSTDDPFDVIDVRLLVGDIIECQGSDYDGVSEINDYFDGYLLELEMQDVLKDLSLEELNHIVEVFKDEDLDFDPNDIDENNIKDVVLEELTQIFYDQQLYVVYSLPAPVQEKFFEFAEADLDYLTDIAGRKGALPAGKSLELAGFKHETKNFYSKDFGSHFMYYDVNIKNGVLKSAEETTVNQVYPKGR